MDVGPTKSEESKVDEMLNLEILIVPDSIRKVGPCADVVRSIRRLLGRQIGQLLDRARLLQTEITFVLFLQRLSQQSAGDARELQVSEAGFSEKGHLDGSSGY